MTKVEEVARAIVRAKGATIVASDEHWPKAVAAYHEMVAEWPEYADAHSLITDAMREARAAIWAMCEPSAAMLAVGEELFQGDAAPEAIFQAMVARALSD